MKRFFSIIGVTIIILITVSVYAQVPQTMSYQGVLTDTGGTVVSDGNYSLVANIYDVETNGSALWTETHASTAVVSGVFNLILGSVTTLDIAFDTQYWLGISVEGGVELTPRTKLAAAPYSLQSRAVLGINNVFPDSGAVGIGTTSPTNKLDVAGGAVIGAAYSGTEVAPANGLLIEGNVGIGKSDPAVALDVYGEINATHFGAYQHLFSGGYGEANTSYQFDIEFSAGFLLINAAGNGSTQRHGLLYFFSGAFDTYVNTLLADNKTINTYITDVSVSSFGHTHTVTITVNPTFVNYVGWNFLPL
ncbi:MAG: hypothetical protein GY869_00490 [Planctomycetes bacterium]|nr:hypothetical protein [Planctomycetota bacterium]